MWVLMCVTMSARRGMRSGLIKFDKVADDCEDEVTQL